MAQAKARTQQESRLLAALCYVLWPLALVVLLLDKKDAFARYGAINGLGFALAMFVLSIPVAILSHIPFIGAVVWAVFWICVICAAILYALRTYQGDRVRIPVVTELLEKNVKNFP